MELRGKHIRWAPVILLVACFVAGPLALGAQGAPHHPSAIASKKCKKKRHGKKRRCKRERKAALPARLAISPTSQDFGIPTIPDGATRTFVVTNTGGMPSGVPIPAITGANADSFKIAANGCVTLLGPSLTCQIDVPLPPRGAGLASAALTSPRSPGGPPRRR